MAAGPDELRTELAATLARGAALGDEEAAALADAARLEEGFCDAVLEALLDQGHWRGEAAGPVSLERLPGLPPGLLDRLDLLRARELAPLQELRLGRLYSLCGQQEKAASCYRAALSRPDPFPLALAIDVAEAAVGAASPTLALGAIDWVAERLLTPQGEQPADPVQSDPLASAGLLVRAAAVASTLGLPPRAVALSKAALQTYERLDRGPEVRRGLAQLARAHAAAGQGKQCLATVSRLRKRAQEDAAPADEALAMALAADQLAAGGKLGEARKLYQEASRRLLETGDPEGATVHELAAARLWLDQGQRARAASALEDAADRHAAAGKRASELRLRRAALELDLAQGRLERVLTHGEELRKAWEELNDASEVAGAIALLAGALTLAGDPTRARKALARCALHLDDWAAAGQALRIRADLALTEEHPADARGLLALAARNLQEAGAGSAAAEALLRRAELALDADEPDACRVDLKLCRAATGDLDRSLSLRAELLRARLSTDLDERELLLEEAQERAGSEGSLLERVLAAAARARHHLRSGDGDLAQEALTPALRELSRVREALPAPLREGFRRSLLLAPLLSLAAQASDQA
jgi:hypothetical protein